MPPPPCVCWQGDFRGRYFHSHLLVARCSPLRKHTLPSPPYEREREDQKFATIFFFQARKDSCIKVLFWKHFPSVSSSSPSCAKVNFFWCAFSPEKAPLFCIGHFELSWKLLFSTKMRSEIVVGGENGKEATEPSVLMLQTMAVHHHHHPDPCSRSVIIHPPQQQVHHQQQMADVIHPPAGMFAPPLPVQNNHSNERREFREPELDIGSKLVFVFVHLYFIRVPF